MKGRESETEEPGQERNCQDDKLIYSSEQKIFQCRLSLSLTPVDLSVFGKGRKGIGRRPGSSYSALRIKKKEAKQKPNFLSASTEKLAKEGNENKQTHFFLLRFSFLDIASQELLWEQLQRKKRKKEKERVGGRKAMRPVNVRLAVEHTEWWSASICIALLDVR